MTTDFQSQLALLKELQEIDLRLSEITSKIEALPERISAVETAYNDVKTEHENSRRELDEAEKARRKEELELANTTENLRQRESRLYAIKTNKEYQAVLKEIAEAKKANKEREERILEYMEKIESLTKKIAQLDKDLADKKAAFSRESEILRGEEEGLKKQFAEFEKRRPDILSKLDPKIVKKYDHIRRRYDDALVRVEKGVCQGCSMNVTPQLYNEMLRYKELKNCPCCHRLIYVAREEDDSSAPSPSE
jgi:predicted  nucleic acid-binding Zn-ribbon protein